MNFLSSQIKDFLVNCKTKQKIEAWSWTKREEANKRFKDNEDDKHHLEMNLTPQQATNPAMSSHFLLHRAVKSEN